MTTTSTTDLQGILSAKKAELTGQPSAGEIIDADVVDMTTGEIVPVAAGVPPAAPAPPVDPLVHYPEVPPKVVGGLPYIREYVKLARTIMQTEMVPRAFQGRYDAITAAFMRGYELGLGPMQALDSFNVIEGKVGLSAEAMRALIMQAGHLFILSEEPGVAYVTCRRSDWPKEVPNAVYRYDLDDAKIAGLLKPSKSGKPTGWDKNPRAMLAARATSGAGRSWFADVLAGMSYTPEEIRDFTDEQEAPPSPTAPAVEPPPTTPPPASDSLSGLASTPTTDPTDAVATVSSEETSGSSSPSVPTVDSTGSASATSSEGTDDSAPPTATPPPARPRGRPKKAASTAAPTAPPQGGLTLLDAPLEPPPETTSLNDPQPGAVGVHREMLSALTSILAGLPTVQQPLCRSFIRRHFPDGHAELSEDEIQKCIDIAVGWPDSADQHPLPDDVENPF